jgi:hypothetical protein
LPEIPLRGPRKAAKKRRRPRRPKRSHSGREAAGGFSRGLSGG